jgi:hypothetical protein
VGAVALDVAGDRHPTHTLGLALVAGVVAALRLQLGGRHDDLFSRWRTRIELANALFGYFEIVHNLASVCSPPPSTNSSPRSTQWSELQQPDSAKPMDDHPLSYRGKLS